MFKHQCRVGSDALAAARPKLLALVPEFAKCKSFSEIHSLVQDATQFVYRFGRLATYDLALRISAKRGLHPDEVYLHCGSLEGAKNLGLLRRNGRVAFDQLPPPMQKLTADQAENFLCRMKDELSPLV
jgi:hypothetical protein